MIDERLWIVGQLAGPTIDESIASTSWEFIGVFSDEAKAVDACRDKRYFIGPVNLNEAFPPETVPWDGAYYPLVEGE